MKQLIKEASRLGNEINIARFEGKIPSADATVRLLEVTDLLQSALEELIEA